jgi:hypothetical protein
VWWSITDDNGLRERDVQLAEEISAVAPDPGGHLKGEAR